MDTKANNAPTTVTEHQQQMLDTLVRIRIDLDRILDRFQPKSNESQLATIGTPGLTAELDRNWGVAREIEGMAAKLVNLIGV